MWQSVQVGEVRSRVVSRMSQVLHVHSGDHVSRQELLVVVVKVYKVCVLLERNLCLSLSSRGYQRDSKPE